MRLSTWTDGGNEEQLPLALGWTVPLAPPGTGREAQPDFGRRRSSLEEFLILLVRCCLELSTRGISLSTMAVSLQRRKDPTPVSRTTAEMREGSGLSHGTHGDPGRQGQFLF